MAGIKQAAGMRAKKPKTPTGVRGKRNAAFKRSPKRTGLNKDKTGYRKV